MADKTKLTSLRIRKELFDQIEVANQLFCKQRGSAAKKVTQTETIEMLISLGLKSLGIKKEQSQEPLRVKVDGTWYVVDDAQQLEAEQDMNFPSDKPEKKKKRG